VGDSPYNSPVQAAYEVMAGNVPDFIPTAGDLIIPGASTKPDPKSGQPDHSRFARFHKGVKNQIQGVVAGDAGQYAFEPIGEVLSASDFRSALDAGESITKWIPEGADEELVYNILEIEKKEEIEEPIEERDYQKDSEAIKDHPAALNRLLDKGPNPTSAGGSGYGKKRSPGRAKSRAPGYGPVGEVSAMGNGAVEGHAGKRDDKKRKNSLIREDDELIEQILDYLLQNNAQEN